MDQSVSFNNEGASHLCAGNLDTAIRCFTSALEKLRRIDASSFQVKNDENLRTFVPIPELVNDHELASESGDTIFDKVFRIPISDNQDFSSSFAKHLLTTIILFNLALCYHIRSMTARYASRFVDLKRAKRMYKIGIRAVFAMEAFSFDGQILPLYPLLSALCNNLCCLATDDFDFDTIEHCIEWVCAGDIPGQAPSNLLNYMAWCDFKTRPAPMA